MKYTATDLWETACSGETEKLKGIIHEWIPGIDENIRYYRFGKNHSLIMGAFRNGHFDTVEMLIDEGGTVEEHEKAEIKAYINDKRIDIMEKMLFASLTPTENLDWFEWDDEYYEDIEDGAENPVEKYIARLAKELNKYKAIIK